jgi:hypothetical protein
VHANGDLYEKAARKTGNDTGRLANPQTGAIMAYRQSKAETRAAHHQLSRGIELNGKARSLDDPRVRRGEIAGFLRARL